MSFILILYFFAKSSNESTKSDRLSPNTFDKRINGKIFFGDNTVVKTAFGKIFRKSS